MTAQTGLLHELLDNAVRRWPDRAALSVKDTTVSYRELDAASRRLSAWLHREGLGRGQRVVVHSAASPLVPALVYAASRIGAPFSVLHEQVRGSALEHVLDDCEPALLVSDASDPVPHGSKTRVVPAGELEEVAFSPSAEAAGAPFPAPIGVDPACLIYTSGTTSRPKAVVSTHHQMTFAVSAIQSVLGYRPADVVFSPLPLSFDYGLYQLFLAASAGAHVRLGLPGEVGPRLPAALHASGATVLAGVPSVAETLARLLARTTKAPTRLRMLTNTGAAMPPEVLRTLRAALPELRIHLMFGLTECKRATIMPADGDLERPGSSGRALPGTEVLVVDPAGRRLPAGETGEITVRGPNVMSGYWRRPELTAARFVRTEGLFPELRTGDFGRIDEEGYLYFAGRDDDIYKENGFRVSATEVEASARMVSGVRSAAVLPPTTAAPAALFVVSGLTAGDVLSELRNHIEEFKIPRNCFVLPDLPLTSNGKVDRKALIAFAEEHNDGRA
ncbi:class I adenylate-forming enzyme family protein [Kitasatospora phosalacinea]|uniref:class I adenylate-forming enzyme family protein n=1 Tax=Kitasatospora phosalacinea TaxID=2065 RepID=UPI0035E0F686